MGADRPPPSHPLAPTDIILIAQLYSEANAINCQSASSRPGHAPSLIYRHLTHSALSPDCDAGESRSTSSGRERFGPAAGPPVCLNDAIPLR